MSELPGVNVTGIRGETDRMTLRLYRADDGDRLSAVYPDEEAVRFVPFGRVAGEELEQMMGRRMQPSFAADGDRVFLIAEDKASGACAGEFGVFLHSVQHRTAEVGYGINPAMAGRGLATEGARAMLALAFDQLGLHRVIATGDSRNDASLRVMAKAGMRKEAHHVSAELHKGEWCDEVVYAMVEDEWTGESAVSWRF